jgi:acetyl-CoA acetyltransferase
VNQFANGREVVVAGVGLHPFGRFPDKDLASLATEPVLPALLDAGDVVIREGQDDTRVEDGPVGSTDGWSG